MSSEGLTRASIQMNSLLKLIDTSSTSSPIDSTTLFLYKKTSSDDLWMNTLGGGETKVNGGGGGGSITSLPDLTSIQGQTLSPSVWQYVNTLNQNVATTSSPSFVNTTNTGVQYLSNGLVATPSLAFTSSTNTGIYYTGSAHGILFANNGVNTIAVDDNGINIKINGTSTTPSLHWDSDPNTGLYRPTSDQIGFTCQSILTAILTSDQVQFSDGKVNHPSITFISDSSTGFYRPALNQIGVTVNNSLVGTWSSTGLALNTLALSGISTASGSTASFTTLTGTLSTASQPNITTLAGLTSIQGQSLASTVWPFVSTMNQSLSSTSGPTFSKTTYSGIASNANGIITSTGNHVNIKTSTNATSGSSIMFSVDTVESGSGAGLAPMRMGLEYIGNATRSNCIWTLNSLEPGVAYKGTLRVQTSGGNISLGNSSGNITVSGRLISDTMWSYVQTMQDVSLNGTPTFRQVTIQNTGGGYLGDYINFLVLRFPTGEAGITNFYNVYVQRPDSGSVKRIAGWFENMFIGTTPVATPDNGLYVEGPIAGGTFNDNTNGNITNGTYAPTTATTVGTFTVTVNNALYIRNGNYIEISVYASLSAITSGSTFSFTVTLPISKTSNFANAYDTQGVGNSDLSPATAATTIAVVATTGAKTITCTLKTSTAITTSNVVVFKASYVHD